MDDKLRLKKVWRKQPREGKLEDYNINLPDKIIGKGSFATVIKATTKEGDHPRAIKVLSKERMSDKGVIKAEVEILAQLDHPNIIRLYETFEDEKNIYLVMELCRGGEVFDRIIEKGHFTESQARSIFTEIMHAVNYCHTNGVCHRDLKLENFLYLDNTPNSHIKVIDFGVAKSFAHTHFREHSKSLMTERVGTVYYISPEVLAGSYDESCDIWSAGVILYILLSGVPPFNGKTDAEILAKIKEQTYSFDSAEWKNVSASAKNLIRNMLCTPRFRLKAEQVLNHPWMLQEEHKDEKSLNLNYDSMRNFTKARKLKKIAMTVIASQMEEEEIMELSDMFIMLDRKGDGVLTFEEIQASAKELNGRAHSKIMKVLESIEIDKRRGINYTEFIAATMEKSLYMKEDRLMEAFSIIDKDGIGKITIDELKDVMGGDRPYDKSYYEQIIREADLNGDGMIDYYEFSQLMKKT